MRANEIISEEQLNEIDLKKLRTVAGAAVIGGALALAPMHDTEAASVKPSVSAEEFIRATPKDQTVDIDTRIPIPKLKPARASKELIDAMIHAESRGDPNARNRKSGAQGLMQLMPATAKAMGVTDPFDPEQNRAGGTKYINSLIARYDGDYELALMAFNWGPARVARWLSKGKPNIIPKETRNYVEKLLPIALGVEVATN